MVGTSQERPTTKSADFATLAVVALSPEEIAARIREGRKAKRWTHEEFARQMGVGLRTVQRWQTGRNPKDGKSWVPQSIDRLMAIADVLEIPRSYLVEVEPGAGDGPWSEIHSRLEAVEHAQGQQSEMLAELLQLVRHDEDATEPGEAPE